MKKTIFIVLSLLLLISGCANSQIKKSGTFKGEAQGFGGMVIAYVVLNEGKIEEVYLEGPKETIGKGSVALEEMPAKIVESQSADVDGVAGATVTSKAVVEAVKLALESNEEVEYVPLSTEISYNPGTYTGKGFGHNFYTTVEVTFSEDTIESVKVTEDKSDAAMSKATIDSIPERIVDGQTLNVDIVAGATQSSSAIISAVADCVNQAAGEDVVNALKKTVKEKTEAKDEAYTADVAIVGGGGSGLTTAYSLASQGYSVVVLEASDILGGMSNVCGGGSLSIGSKLQTCDEKINYSEGECEKLQSEYTDILNKASNNNPQAESIINAYVDALDEFVDWANESGISYSASGKTGVRLINKGSRFDTIVEKMSSAGTKILTGTRGTELIMEDGMVAGVSGINSTGGTTTVKAKAVVLSTGGFLANDSLTAQEFDGLYDRTYWENWFGSSYYQGDGIMMAWNAGAAKGAVGVQPHDSQIPEALHDEIEIATHMPSDYATAAYMPNTLWVNKDGERFCDENIAAVKGAEAHGAAQLKAGVSYALLSAEMIDKLADEGTAVTGWMGIKDTPLANLKAQLEGSINSGWACKASSAEEAAEFIGCDKDTLKNTIDSYNSYVENGLDEQYGKDPALLNNKVDENDFYVLAVTTRMLAAYGGLVVDGDMRVLNEAGEVIDGLYATGLDAGFFMGDIYSVTTVTAGFAICSGYMAGNSIGDYLAK